jgi:hypothetical protein
MQGTTISQSVLKGAANLVAVGLEGARAQDLAQQVDAAWQSGQLRTTLIDADAATDASDVHPVRGATLTLCNQL